MSATPSAQYRLTIRVKLDDSQGILGRVTGAIGEAGGMVGAVDLVEVGRRPQPARHRRGRLRARALARGSSPRSTRSRAPR